jgi:hypothetical protein
MHKALHIQFLNEHIVISQTHEFDHVPNKLSETPISDQS